MMIENMPWMVAAVNLKAIALAEVVSPDHLTRLAGESRMAIALATLNEAMQAVQLLEHCWQLSSDKRDHSLSEEI